MGPSKFTSEAIDDFVDIVVSNEYFQRKLIFTNTKNQQNGLVYKKILTKLKAKCSARGADINFTVSQLRTKFKKCVSDCKVAALTIKTATGIKRFQEDKGFGNWFNNLFALAKTRDSCNPQQAVEPSATKNTTEDEGAANERVLNKGQNLFVPVKSAKNKSKNRDAVSEAIDLMKQTLENDPRNTRNCFHA